VDLRKDVYIRRPSDDEVFELLKSGEYCNVVSSRQMGKTSLLFRTEWRLAEVGVKTCSIDVGGILGSPETADAWYQDLLDEIADQIGLSLDVAAWWRANPSATANRRLIQFFRDEVAVKAGAPVVIFLDEIEYTLKFPYTDDFFLAIRAMHNDRQRVPAFERITFCLLGVATPNELIKNDRTTPYNIGRTIELRDFEPERDDLSAVYSAVDDDPETGQRLVGAVLGWTGGHPYLTMKHCADVARAGLKTAQEVDQLIEQSYTSLVAARSDEHFDAVLRFVRQRVDANDRLTALTLYRRIYRGRPEPDRTTPAHIALKLSGLVKRDEHGLLVVRNHIYRRLFTKTWAKEAMPPVARALRNARRWGGASTILFLLAAGIWFEGIYPYLLTKRLNEAIAQSLYAYDTYQFLRGIPFYSGKGDRLWASLLDRRAARAAWRDEALLWWIKALSVLPTERRAREAARLISEDYPSLDRTIYIPESYHVALSSNGRVVARAKSSTVQLWSTENGQPISKLLNLRGMILSLALSGNGRLVATGDRETVALWNSESGEPIGTPLGNTRDDPPGSKWWDPVIALSDDGRVVAAFARSIPMTTLPSETFQSRVRLWRTDSDHPIIMSRVIKGLGSAVALSGDGGVVALSGDGGGTVAEFGRFRIWLGHTKGGEPSDRILDLASDITSVALSGDGRIVAAGDSVGHLRLWRTASGEPIGKPLDVGEEVRTRVAVSGGGQLVAVGTHRGTVRLWHVETGYPVGKPLNLGIGVSNLAVSDDGRVVAVGDVMPNYGQIPGRVMDVLDHILRVWHVALDGSIDGPPNDLLQRNPKDLLHDWEKRLGMQINDLNGEIVLFTMGETRATLDSSEVRTGR
jgi:WD40 repeat protein